MRGLLLSPLSRVLFVAEMVRLQHQRGGVGLAMRLQTREVWIEWSMSGLEFVAQKLRALRLTYPFEVSDRFEDLWLKESAQGVSLGDSKVEARLTIGQIPKSTKKFTCQGVFR